MPWKTRETEQAVPGWPHASLAEDSISLWVGCKEGPGVELWAEPGPTPGGPREGSCGPCFSLWTY